jgi:uncharacterized oxidoreductase
MKVAGNTMLITGGGSGIGRALAHRFQALGNRVIVAGRRQQALDETVGDREGMATAILDVADPDSIDAFAGRVASEYPDLNVVLNGAGIMRYEDVASGKASRDVEETIATNLSGTILLNRALLPHLLGRPGACIITVSSGLAFVPMPATPTYNATKAAIHSYSVAMREQLRGRIEVIELVPPAVRTDLTPGQSSNERFLPLEDFIDEAMALFARQPTPEEILVDRVLFQRNAEREGRFEQALAIFRGH